MTDLGTMWPYALAAVLLLALIIVILLVVVLRRSAKVSTFADAEEPDEEPVAESDDPVEEEMVVSLPEAFRRAAKTFNHIDNDRYQVPLYLLVGAPQSRDANLLSSAGLDLPWGDASESGMNIGMGRGFWFFNKGLVLDLAGSDDKEWDSAIRHLRELRPRRPADGVIVAFPCAELLEASTNEIKRAELAAGAARLFRKLWETQQQLGFRLPVYAIVTGSERLTGFGSLCSSLPESARREMLGWSSPNSVDAAYRGVWVEEAFAAIIRRLEDVQMEVFAAGSAEADWLLRLPLAVASLAKPVRVCLDNLLKSSAYHGSLIFRGLFFCGREGLGSSPEAKPAGKVAFFADLFEKKIFEESGLAAPTARTVVARNRTVRRVQIAAVLAFVLCGSALLWEFESFNHKNAVLKPFLTTASQGMHRQTASDAKVETDLTATSMDLLDKMAAINFRRYGMIVVPSSWFSSFDDHLDHAVGIAFNDVIFAAVDRGMKRKAEALVSNSAYRIEPLQNAAVFEANGTNETELLAASPIVAVDRMPDFVAMQRYVDDVRHLDEHVTTFDRLAKAGSGNLQDLGEVVQYGIGKSVPPSFYKQGELYQRALRADHYREFDRDLYAPRARTVLETLASNFYAALYRRNPFEARLQQLAAALDANAWRQPSGSDSLRVGEIARRMHAIDAALSGPELEWAFRPGSDFNLGPSFSTLLPTIEHSNFLGADVSLRVQSAGASGWKAFRSTLAAAGTPLTGSFLAVRDGEPQMRLSEESLVLEHAIDSFVGQRFVASNVGQGRELHANPSRAVRLVWNDAQLNQVMAVADAYDHFHDKSLQLFPPDLRVSIDQVARDRARADMEDLLAGAADYVAVPPTNGPTMLEEQIRSDIAAFGGQTEILNRVLQAFSRLGSTDSRRAVANVMSIEALRLLRSNDDLLDAEQPYRPRFGGFGWWDGTAPPSPAAWGAKDTAELTAYTETTRARLATQARSYAQPLLLWFTKAGTIDRPDVRPLAQQWQGILDDLRDYDAKKPGNAVAALEDYINARMVKVGPNDCAAAAPPSDVRGGTRYFARTLQGLSRDLSRRCYDMASMNLSTRYAELANYFNQRLAGRYPFSEGLHNGTLEADPADVRAFFHKFDAAKPMLASKIAEADPGFTQARQFIENMTAVRAFFAPFLDAQKPDVAPAYDIEASFRTARQQEVDADQIIAWSLGVGNETVTNHDKKPMLRWSVGKGVRLALRWASNAPRVPVLSQPARGVSVRDRTVTYQYDNQWALLTALSENAAPPEVLPHYDEEEPVTLGFKVFTKPVAGGEPGNVPTQVFMRLALLAPGTTQPIDVPHFPHAAPKLEIRSTIAEGAQ
ncbi:MAG: type secretion system protein ImpL [Thermoanaerobaculia bacterium]|nr:type secretion system protein ImpL [Thermoanaerobaculia bacterium]